MRLQYLQSNITKFLLVNVFNQFLFYNSENNEAIALKFSDNY